MNDNIIGRYYYLLSTPFVFVFRIKREHKYYNNIMYTAEHSREEEQ